MPTSDLPASAAQDNIEGHARPAYEELEHSNLELVPSSLGHFPKPHLPKPNTPEPSSSTSLTMLERYRRRIESLGESLYSQYTGVDESFLQSLEEASKPCGGPRVILGRLIKIAHDEFN